MTACLLALSSGAALEADISFAPGGWNSNDWILVKSPRFDYKHGFVQKEDGIENECPDLPGEEICTRKWNRTVYSAMVLKDRAAIGQTVSSSMSFDWKFAPLIVLAERLDTDAAGNAVFGEHWEIVLHNEGLNVWHHSVKEGKPFWYKAAYLNAEFEKNVRYNVEVKVTKTRKGVKEMVVKCGEREFGYVDNDLPDAFHVGIVGCEGRNRFYGFKVQ